MSTATFRSPGLTALLAREVEAGNAIVEEGMWGEIKMIFLSGPFRTPPPDPATGLIYRDVKDPHYWLAEVYAPATKEVLACRYPSSFATTSLPVRGPRPAP